MRRSIAYTTAICLTIVFIFIAGAFSGVYLHKEVERSKRVRELVNNTRGEGLTDEYFMRCSWELMRIAK